MELSSPFVRIVERPSSSYSIRSRRRFHHQKWWRYRSCRAIDDSSSFSSFFNEWWLAITILQTLSDLQPYLFSGRLVQTDTNGLVQFFDLCHDWGTDRWETKTGRAKSLFLFLVLWPRLAIDRGLDYGKTVGKIHDLLVRPLVFV